MPALRYVTPDGELVYAFEGRLTIGRDPASDVPLSQEPAVSRRHASISGSAESGYVLEDLASRNGVMIERGGSRFRVDETAQLIHGDVILLGSTRLAFDSTVAGASQEGPAPKHDDAAITYVPETTRVGAIGAPPPSQVMPLPPAAPAGGLEPPPDSDSPAGGGNATVLIAAAIVAVVVLAVVLALVL